jgi:hypothetical protein
MTADDKTALRNIGIALATVFTLVIVFLSLWGQGVG